MATWEVGRIFLQTRARHTSKAAHSSLEETLPLKTVHGVHACVYSV